MSDLISRQAAIEYFMTNTNWHDEDGYEIHDAEDKRALLKSYFDGIPSAQPERKVGKWIRFAHSRIYFWECSECHAYHRARYNYCPTCGARMMEGQDE